MQDKMPNLAYISLGSNVGDSRAILEEALKLLINSGLQLKTASSIFRTEPQLDKEQPWFFNQAVKMQTFLEPEDLLDLLQATEQTMGRAKGGRRYGPRTLDLDLLLYGKMIVQTTRLTIPHPRMLERAFVLVPLLEMEPHLLLPDGRSVSAALAALSYRLEGDKIFQSR